MTPFYKIEITQTAVKQLNKLPQEISSDLIKMIQSLGDNPRPAGCKKIKDRKGYRVRKNNYHIMYDVYDTILVIDAITISHRKDIYD